MNQQLKALISTRAKNQLFVTFTSKAHNNLQGVFPTMIGFVTIGQTKPIMVGKTPCKLLCTFEVKVTNSWLYINFLALVDIRALSC